MTDASLMGPALVVLDRGRRPTLHLLAGDDVYRKKYRNGTHSYLFETTCLDTSCNGRDITGKL